MRGSPPMITARSIGVVGGMCMLTLDDCDRILKALDVYLDLTPDRPTPKGYLDTMDAIFQIKAILTNPRERGKDHGGGYFVSTSCSTRFPSRLTGAALRGL